MDGARQDKDLAKFKNESRGLEGIPSIAKAGWSGEEKKTKRKTKPRWTKFQRGFVSRLARAAILKEVFRAHDLAVKCSRDPRFAFDFACFGISDGDVIHLESASERAFVVGFGFLEISQCAQFGALCGDEVTLRENHVVNGGRSEPVFLLLGVEGLLLKLARFASGIHLSPVLCECDVCVAYVEKRGVFQLLQYGFLLALGEVGAGTVCLRGTVAQGQAQSQLRGIVGKAIVEELALRGGEALLIRASNRGPLFRLKNGNSIDEHRIAIFIQNRQQGIGGQSGSAFDRRIAGQTNGAVLSAEREGGQQRVARGLDIDIRVFQIEELLLKLWPFREGFLDGVLEGRVFNRRGLCRLVGGDDLDVHHIWRQRILSDGIFEDLFVLKLNSSRDD